MDELFLTTMASPSVNKRILHFSDVHLNLSATLDDVESRAMRARYGADATITLLESALAYATIVIPAPDLLLYTGDHVVHADGLSDEYVTHVVEANLKMFDKYYPRETARNRVDITTIMGNADTNPSYSMAVTDPEDTNVTNPSIDLISHVWNTSLTKRNWDFFRRRGYLAYELDDKLTVLTLNTVPYSFRHTPDNTTLEDPFHQFAWLNATLNGLRSQAKFAYIVGHIPPIVDSNRSQSQWHEPYVHKYKAIVSGFRDVIKAQLFGHVHSVEFRLPVDDFSDANNNNVPPLLLTGALSPKYDNNPSFTVWEYSPETYEFLDYTVYGTNISEAVDADGAIQFQWKKLYQASETFQIESLSSGSLQDLYARMVADPVLLDEYYWDRKAQSHRQPLCDTPTCRSGLLCTLKWWTTNDEFDACISLTLEQLVPPPAEPPTTPRGGAGEGAGAHTTHPPSLAPLVLFAMAMLCAAVAGVWMESKRRREKRKRRASHHRVINKELLYGQQDYTSLDNLS